MNCKQCQSKRLNHIYIDKPDGSGSHLIECMDCFYSWFNKIKIIMENLSQLGLR